MTNPLLRGPVDLLRPSVHGLASSLRLVAPRSCQRISRPCNDLQCRDSGLVQRTLRNIAPGSSGSLGLDVGGPDHLAPFFSFLLKPPPVIRGRAAGDAAAQVGKSQL